MTRKDIEKRVFKLASEHLKAHISGTQLGGYIFGYRLALKDFESRSCYNCAKYSEQDMCAVKYIPTILEPSTFACNQWETNND